MTFGRNSGRIPARISEAYVITLRMHAIIVENDLETRHPRHPGGTGVSLTVIVASW